MAPDAGFGVLSLDDVRTVDGLTLFKGMIEGRYPAPPIARAIGFEVAKVEFGYAVFTYTPIADHLNPLGNIHGGIAATMLDGVMGCCVHTTLKAGIGYTTLEIKVNYVRPMTEKTGKVRAEGRTINVGSRIATSEGRLYDENDRLLAHGTTTCLIFAI